MQKTKEHGGKKVSEEGEATPSGLVGQANNFDLYSKRNGKGFKKRIYLFFKIITMAAIMENRLKEAREVESG